MKWYACTFLPLLILMWAFPVWGAEFVSPQSSTDLVVIDHEKPGMWYFGTLDDAPHTFMLYLDETKEVKLQVLVPARGGAEAQTKGAIIVKQATRGVDEVARLKAETASWDPFTDWITADRYVRGAEFNGSLDSGVYIIEVHSPDNLGPYVLTYGTGGSLSGYNYFKNLAQVYHIKQSNGSPIVWMILSPLVYIPLVLLAIGLWWYRKKYA